MIPSADQILPGLVFLARRQGLPGPRPSLVRDALELARSLAGSVNEEPAALFYAFGSMPNAVPGASRATARLVAANHARLLGRRLRATADELDDLCARLARSDRPPFGEVRTWFEARLS